MHLSSSEGKQNIKFSPESPKYNVIQGFSSLSLANLPGYYEDKIYCVEICGGMIG